ARSAAASASRINAATESWPMKARASATDRLATLAFCRTPDLAAPAAPAADDAASETPSATEEALVAADRAGFRAFDSSQAALLGSSLSPVLVVRDRRRTDLVFAMRPPPRVHVS